MPSLDLAIKFSEGFAQAGGKPVVARQPQAIEDPGSSHHAMISARANPLLALTTMRAFFPKRLRIAATIFFNASTVPSLASRLASRSFANSGIVPQKQ